MLARLIDHRSRRRTVELDGVGACLGGRGGGFVQGARGQARGERDDERAAGETSLHPPDVAQIVVGEAQAAGVTAAEDRAAPARLEGAKETISRRGRGPGGK